MCLVLMNGLDVALYDNSLECIQPTESDLCRVAVIRDSFGNRAAHKCAKRKLTALGTAVGHCGVVNSEETTERTREQLAKKLRRKTRHRKGMIGTKNTMTFFPTLR